MTARAIVIGLILSVVMCGMNTFLTLSFGVIEEGPTIAALFFFAFFMLSKTKITTQEMAIVATMGSAGGVLGFIGNFFAAKAMTGTPYTFWEMALFCISTSLVGLAAVIPLRQLLVIKEKLPWPGARATESVIRALVEHGDPKQAKVLLVATVALIVFVVGNNDGGFGWFPAETHLGPLIAVGGAIAWAPFAIGGSYLMGMSTCVGFLVGAIALMVMAPYTGTPEAPHRFFWPGLGFLVFSGLFNLARNWRAFAGIFSAFRGGHADDDDPIMSSRQFVVFSVVSVLAAIAVLTGMFGLSPILVILLIAVGGFIQNLIATRAAALTNFNPARVMGIMLQGLISVYPGANGVAANLTGGGFVAGAGGEASSMCNDFVYGRGLNVKARHQFWVQCLTVVPASISAALVFQWLNAAQPITFDTKLAAPVAKMWAASAKLFDGSQALPEGAINALLIGGIVGVVYVILERIKPLSKVMPESTGVGLGLVLAPALGIAFFVGGFLMWIVLGKWLKVNEVTLTTLAVASIVAEGIGGVAKPLLTLAGVIHGAP